MTQEQELFTILSSMILNKTYCRLDKDLNSKYKDSLFRVQGIQLLDSGEYLILLECMDDPNGRFTTSNILQIKPYLHSMSNMTEEQKKQWFNVINHHDKEGNPILTFMNLMSFTTIIESINWLNTNRFDYYGLIEKGLALEAPEGMYDTKTE